MRLTDGNKIIDIEMKVWQGTGYAPDWSMDFFGTSDLPYDEKKDAYIVKDVQYCIEQAYDWRDSQGDYNGDEPNPDNTVVVEEIG